jgi:ADP-ribosylglycohydrolase
MKQGGDTDTNACIVGTMVGALVGIDNLPSNYLNNLLKCDVLKSNRKRNESYSPWQSIFICE